MAHPLPSEYTFGKVVGRAIHAIADTAADEDHLPEARPAVGRVRFTPKTSIRKAGHDYSAFVLKSTVHAELDELGRIIDAEGRLGIWLVTGLYTVSWDVDGQIPGFTIEVTDAHTDESPLDLVTAAPPQPGPGITVQTLIVPAGAAPGQVLGWTPDGLGWIDPEVAGDVSPEVLAARDQAVSAAQSAQGSATAAAQSAVDAGDDRVLAQQAAASAQSSADSIGTSVADAAASASTAQTAATAAQTARTGAETARDEAVAAAGEAGGGAGMPAGMVPIFESLTDAQDWETANPGRTALWIDISEAPGEPDPGATYNDFAYRWLGKDATTDGWADTVAGLTLEHTANSSGFVSVSGDAAIFEHTNEHFGPYFTGELPGVTSEHTTDLWVHRASTSSTAYLRGLGGNVTRGLMSPGGGGNGVTPWMGGNKAATPGIPLDQDWHVTVVRWSPGGTVITRDEASSTAPVASAVPSPYVFDIGLVTGAANTKPYRGEIREVRVWNRRLSDDEVADVVAELRGVYGL